MRVTIAVVGAACTVNVGAAAVPFVDLYTLPYERPTQSTSEFPGATAIALMCSEELPWIALHPGAAALTLFVRQRLAPPASIRFGLFGSRMNGAMKSASRPASLIPDAT